MSATLTLIDLVLVEGIDSPAVPGSRVVVEDGVIVAVERADGHADESHAVQGHGRWLLPGLWDTHMHHGLSAGGLSSAEELSADRLLTWRAYVRSGVTSVVSTGDDSQRMIAAQAAEREANSSARRIFCGGQRAHRPGRASVGTLMQGHAVGVGALAVAFMALPQHAVGVRAEGRGVEGRAVPVQRTRARTVLPASGWPRPMSRSPGAQQRMDRLRWSELRAIRVRAFIESSRCGVPRLR